MYEEICTQRGILAGAIRPLMGEGGNKFASDPVNRSSSPSAAAAAVIIIASHFYLRSQLQIRLTFRPLARWRLQYSDSVHSYSFYHDHLQLNFRRIYQYQ